MLPNPIETGTQLFVAAVSGHLYFATDPRPSAPFSLCCRTGDPVKLEPCTAYNLERLEKDGVYPKVEDYVECPLCIGIYKTGFRENSKDHRL